MSATLPRMSRLLVPLVVLLLSLFRGPAAAQPAIPKPTLKGVLGGDLIARAIVRWSKRVGGERVEVSVHGGGAQRLNPAWAPGPARLPYDMQKARALERELKRARLGAPTPAATGPEDRTLELLGRGPSGWEVVGSWTLSRRTWQKRSPALYRLLEPLFDVAPDVFAPEPGKPR